MNELAVLFLKGFFALMGVYLLYCMCYWKLYKPRSRRIYTTYNPYEPYVQLITPQTLPNQDTWRKRALDNIQAIRDDPVKRRILINRLWPDREPTCAELESVLEPPPEDFPDLNELGNPTEDPLPDYFLPTDYWTPTELAEVTVKK